MKTKVNCMGTISFTHKFHNMRKEQEFDVYPIKSGDENIMIQSDTRIGLINIATGKVKLSQTHSNGAYATHLNSDILIDCSFSDDDYNRLKEAIKATTKDLRKSGSVVQINNSGAALI